MQDKGCVKGNYTVEVESHDTAVLLVRKGACRGNDTPVIAAAAAAAARERQILIP